MSAPDEELARLRAEVDELRARLSASPPGTDEREADHGRAGWWRTPLVTVLVVLGALTAPLSVVATWAHDEIGDSDRYVETVAPLATEPAIQGAIADAVTTVIVTNLRIEDVTSDALSALSQQSFIPPRAAPLLPALAVPLSNAVEQFVRDTVERVVESDAFEEAWVTANRRAHESAVAVLTGKGADRIAIQDGEVSVNIGSIVETAKQLLVDRGFALAERIPEVDATFVLFASDDIGQAQTWFSWLETSARVLPVLGLVLLATAVLVARDRRRALLAAALAVAVSMVLLGLVLNLVRPLYLDAVPDDVLPAEAAAVVYDQLIGFIRTALRAVFVVALAVAVTAFLLARAGPGAAIRTGAAGLAARLRERSGIRRGPVATFVATYRNGVRGAVVGIAVLWYVMLDHPTGGSALLIVVLAVLGIVVFEVVAGPRTAAPVVTDPVSSRPPPPPSPPTG
ncbi:hypothetical protein KV097_11535 [Mumia sp. zg.B17]|uniref:hypothetical protein n=1 Tax=Mumia sp. zg.B17 TaxID=2855446 RepID=UPI001C6EDB5E|nr:hypothetical protein [Mumia sp. zg.B17]MBW9206573.1 hypothetical protein [Mumia sp. zg.B17]